jgi:hypothetical protein
MWIAIPVCKEAGVWKREPRDEMFSGMMKACVLAGIQSVLMLSKFINSQPCSLKVAGVVRSECPQGREALLVHLRPDDQNLQPGVHSASEMDKKTAACT